MKQFILKLSFPLILGLSTHSAFATENGADSFALGAEGMMAGALPHQVFTY